MNLPFPNRILPSLDKLANHKAIFNDVGLEVKDYRYWKPSTRSLDLEGMLEDLNNAPSGSIILIHSCAHNPTGVDPTPEQWAQIAAVMRAKNHFTFFDCAYQGFASGNVDRDAYSVRHFVEQGMEVFVAQSYSKNFGLYGERCGCLTVVTRTPEQSANVRSQLCKILRAMISNPPSYGARIVSLILNNPQLYAEWLADVKMMADRIMDMRVALLENLTRLGTPGAWNHVVDQIGMFSFTGLNGGFLLLLLRLF